MKGDINRTFRINPKSQEAIEKYMNERKKSWKHKQELTINRCVNEMLSIVGSDDYLNVENVISHRDALKKRLSSLKKVIKKHSRKLWDGNKEIRESYDCYEDYLYEVWDVLY